MVSMLINVLPLSFHIFLVKWDPSSHFPSDVVTSPADFFFFPEATGSSLLKLDWLSEVWFSQSGKVIHNCCLISLIDLNFIQPWRLALPNVMHLNLFMSPSVNTHAHTGIAAGRWECLTRTNRSIPMRAVSQSAFSTPLVLCSTPSKVPDWLTYFVRNCMSMFVCLWELALKDRHFQHFFFFCLWKR